MVRRNIEFLTISSKKHRVLFVILKIPSLSFSFFQFFLSCFEKPWVPPLQRPLRRWMIHAVSTDATICHRHWRARDDWYAIAGSLWSADNIDCWRWPRHDLLSLLFTRTRAASISFFATVFWNLVNYSTADCRAFTWYVLTFVETWFSIVICDIFENSMVNKCIHDTVQN